MPPQFPIQGFPAALGDGHYMVFASHLVWLRLFPSSIANSFVCFGGPRPGVSAVLATEKYLNLSVDPSNAKQYVTNVLS
jgi:hypothetical protein